jgi:hypothetical protein
MNSQGVIVLFLPFLPKFRKEDSRESISPCESHADTHVYSKLYSKMVGTVGTVGTSLSFNEIQVGTDFRLVGTVGTRNPAFHPCPRKCVQI